MDTGYIQIYTGNGKGKTIAALGLALRAAGAGFRTLIIQFMKEKFPYSELNSINMLAEYVTIERFGSDVHVIEKRPPSEWEREDAKRGVKRAHEALTGGAYEILILDEICVAVHFGLIAEDDVLPLLRERPEGVELILTGRYCPDKWIELADLVTEMREVKHYFQRGVTSRKGIDS